MQSKRSSWAVPRVSAVVVAVAAAGMMDIATAHASSGGGCNQNTIGATFAVQVCVSAHGSSLLPDYYIIREQGWASAEFTLVDATTDIVVQDLKNLPSGVGHHGPYSWNAPTNGHQYFSALRLTSGSVSLNGGTSPLETFHS